MKSYRVITAKGEFVTGSLTLQAAKDLADQFHRRDKVHYGVVAIEHVYTTSTLEDALSS